MYSKQLIIWYLSLLSQWRNLLGPRPLKTDPVGQEVRTLSVFGLGGGSRTSWRPRRVQHRPFVAVVVVVVVASLSCVLLSTGDFPVPI